MLTDTEIREMLVESGVANDTGHYENNLLHTAITSFTELKKFAELVYWAGYECCDQEHDDANT